MKRLPEHLYAILVTLWVGAMWAVGYLAAPVLFRQLDDRMLAGRLAGQMFTVVAWIGIACAAYLLVFMLLRKGGSAFGNGVFWLVMAMLLLTVAGHFGIQPVLEHLKAESWPREVMASAVRDRFAAWHGISSIVYLIQSLLGAVLVVLQSRGLR